MRRTRQSARQRNAMHPSEIFESSQSENDAPIPNSFEGKQTETEIVED